MNVAKRTRTLKTLLDLRLGPGAAILPPSITHIHLTFAYKLNAGHFGARKLWRLYLPRLKYHNPGVSMTVQRHRDNVGGPAVLTVGFSGKEEGGVVGGGGGGGGGREKRIEMRGRREEEILEDLMRVTGGREVVATIEEVREREEMAEERRRADVVRQREARLLEVKREEKRLMDVARGTVS